MEPFQPFLIALLILLVAVTLTLLVQTRRARRQRRQEQAVIAAATPRVRSRLAAIVDPSIPPEPEPPYVPYAVLAAMARRVSIARAESTRRRVWRDASAALVVFAGLGLIIVFALPAAGGQTAPDPSGTPPEAAVLATGSPTAAATLAAIALAPSPLPTRIEIVLPTEVPTPTLPITQTPRPTERVTTAARATPRPTPKPTPRPTPKPTPVPAPVARFSYSISDMTVNFSNTSKTYGATATYSWDFGDGGSSAKTSPAHTYSDSGCYVVTLKVKTKGGSDASTKVVGVGLSCP